VFKNPLQLIAEQRRGTPQKIGEQGKVPVYGSKGYIGAGMGFP
jgi:hypothetical protein